MKACWSTPWVCVRLNWRRTTSAPWLAFAVAANIHAERVIDKVVIDALRCSAFDPGTRSLLPQAIPPWRVLASVVRTWRAPDALPACERIYP